MNTVAAETSGAAVRTDSPSYQEIHIIFKDIYQGDHHLILFAEQGDDDDQTKDNAKAKAKKHLEHENADEFSIKMMTEEEYQKSPRSQQQIFYVLYQNGKRNYLPLLATDPEEAETIFNQRMTTNIIAYRVFSRQEFKDLLTDGRWKKFHLTPTSPN